ncbi:MAG: hypothetical protein FWF80_07700 [Defluviitaleaceae bacterium]|nr:hypothetical protein [Defluviitaleaceae bacterium]
MDPVSKKGPWAKAKLVFRLGLLVVAVALNFIAPEVLDFRLIFQMGIESAFLWAIWLMIFVMMLFRIIPNKLTTVGARKHFRSSYLEVHNPKAANPDMHKGAVKSALSWFGITAGIVLIFWGLGLLTPGVVVVLTIIYSLCDSFFVMFKCPFRLLYLNNRCCADCRIYNWDNMMMCAPLIVFPSVFSTSLFLLALAIIVLWEIRLIKNPRFFSREFNANLRCENCGEKKCTRGGGRA